MGIAARRLPLFQWTDTEILRVAISRYSGLATRPSAPLCRHSTSRYSKFLELHNPICFYMVCTCLKQRHNEIRHYLL